MNPQIMSHPTTHNLKSVRPTKDGRSTHHDQLSAYQLSEQQSGTAHRLLQQLFQSLTVLGSTSDLALTGRTTSNADQLLRAQLQPNARQAEMAMHELRDLRLTTSPVVTELSQSLTVLVLAADMITQGQLAGTEALSFYDLLRRNTDTAMRALAELFKHFGLDDR